MDDKGVCLSCRYLVGQKEIDCDGCKLDMPVVNKICKHKTYLLSEVAVEIAEY